jgi:glycosyltransferase involved in cell wall biosynthesis
MSDLRAEPTDVALSLVLPAFNESRNLRTGLPVAVEALEETGRSFEIVVVDDGSADRTAEVVRTAAAADDRIRLVQHPLNAGYGAALRSGFQAARGRWVMFTDADFQFDLGEVGRLLAHVDGFDIVAGYRFPRRDPWNRRLNAWAWGRLVNATFDLRIRDVNCAFKLFRREVLEGTELRSDGAFVNTEILARARSRGWRIHQVPVSHFKRRAGVQTGAQPRVVAKAFVELAQLYGDLQHARRGVRQAAARTVVHLSAVAAR